MAKSIKPLTDSQIKKLKSADKEFIVADGYNLYIVVTPSNTKLWRFIYSHPVTKKRIKKSIGRYPDVSLLRARDKARSYNSLLADNVDPCEYEQEQARKEEKRSITVRQMAEIWKAKKALDVLPYTLKDLWGRLELWLFPTFGELKITEINLTDVIGKFTPLYKERPDTVRKVIGHFISILDRAVFMGYLIYNPISSLKGEFKKPYGKNQPAIQYAELPTFMELLEKSRLFPETKLLIEWQLLTMVRACESVSVEWSEIDFEKKIWHIPAHKMKGLRDKKKPHSVPLSTQALLVLKEMKRMNYHGSPFVFPNRLNKQCHCSKGTANSAIKRIDNGSYVGKFTSHGMRSTARTYLTEIDIDHFVAEACLAHATGDTVSRVYNRSEYLERRREAMQKWGDYVERCKNG
ncbi:MAG: tyrosine-type recombinase/integrase [Pasteurellaceae bacterium]|nr:tyrosine-type recombinase/integrase [Pasteurellaceae bacterium]